MSDAKETVIYVTRDIERALGTRPNPHYLIIANRTPFGEKVQRQYPDFVTLTDSADGSVLGTGDLLKHPKTAKVFAAHTTPSSRPYIMVFKNTARIEPLAREHGWTLINPAAAICEKIENKVSQIAWLGTLEKYLPSHRLLFTKNLRWDGTPFVIQWAHGHTGGGTILIRSEADITALKEKFPERRCRATTYIDGPSYTVNAVASPDGVATGSVSYQITGLPPFTESPFTTIGNDWSLARKLLTPDDKQWIQTIVREIGERMQAEHWRGLFGIDFIRDQATGRMYLIEINARQPASTPFESYLEERRREGGAPGATLFEAHLAALLGRPMPLPLIPIEDGAQVVQRVTDKVKSVPETTVGSLELSGYKVAAYPNTEANSDLVRIQSERGIMAAHGEFNEDGKGIIEILSER